MTDVWRGGELRDQATGALIVVGPNGAAVGGSGGIPATLLDAKGDLIVASANDTAIRKAVGVDDTYLRAKASASGGIEWGALPSAVIAEGAAFPGSPAAGDFFSLLVDDTNGVEWLFRRNAANTKWRFQGGAYYYSAVEAAAPETTASTSYVDLATVGPSLTLPAAGLYEIEFGATQASTGASASALVGLSVDGAAPSVATGTQVSNSETTAASSMGPVMRLVRMLVATPATAIKLLYRVSGGTGSFNGRWLAIRPVQI